MADADWTMLDLTKPDTTRLDSLHHPKTVQVCVQRLRSRTNPLTEARQDAAPSPDYLQRMLRKAQVSLHEYALRLLPMSTQCL